MFMVLRFMWFITLEWLVRFWHVMMGVRLRKVVESGRNTELGIEGFLFNAKLFSAIALQRKDVI
jgi:hypothetical protein